MANRGRTPASGRNGTVGMAGWRKIPAWFCERMQAAVPGRRPARRRPHRRVIVAASPWFPSMKHQSGAEADILDAVIVGGGLGGVVMLAEAVQQRYTRILLLERAESLGGLWARVPSWQTIQNHPLPQA